MKMILLQSLLLCLFSSCGTSQQEEQAISYDYYVINKASEEHIIVVNYLYNHFKKRTTDGNVLKEGEALPSNQSKMQFISAVVDKNLKDAYEIIIKDNNLTLKANSKKNLYWLYYQYFQALSECDSKVSGSDLPPSIISFKKSKKGNFAFQYREPHLQANMVEDYDVLINTNSVDKDWGIWGHQLFNLVNKNPKDDYYSRIDGTLNKEQLCFSNIQLYSFLEKYIIEHFGEKETSNQNFVISPADNNLVCTCAECSKLGNVKGNSSASVLTLINKLATRFPNHQFFTIDYLSVKTPPIKKMPLNTGILISSIDLPRKVNLDYNNGFVKEFQSKVQKWNAVSSKVYVWDYISNFDDYLTPFATLTVCKNNFLFYKKLNVSGIFGNGAGYDYSTFHEVHTYVIAALMQDPTLDVNQLVKRYCNFYYGQSGQMIADYILSLEKQMQTKNIKLDLYNGVKKMTGTYLSKADFFDFYMALDNSRKKGNEEAKKRLTQLYTGLTYSAMQIQLISKFDENFGFASVSNTTIKVNENFKNRYLFLLEQFKLNDIFTTRERAGEVSNYLKTVKSDYIEAKLKPNLLNSESLKVVSTLDEDYTDVSLLTDGIPGSTTDYHTGWLIVSANDLIADIYLQKTTGKINFKISFLLDERLKMRAPEKIEVIINKKIARTILPEKKSSDLAMRLNLTTAVDLSADDQIKIKIYRDNTFKKFSCDEIYLYR